MWNSKCILAKQTHSEGHYVTAGSTDLNQLVLGKTQFNKLAATRWTTNGALRLSPSCGTDDLRLQANIPPTYHCGRHEEIPGQEGSQTQDEEDDPYCVVPGEEGQGGRVKPFDGDRVRVTSLH